MSNSTKKTPSQAQIILEDLDRLRRMLEATSDAFDELYHLQKQRRAKNANAHPGPKLLVNQINNVF